MKHLELINLFREEITKLTMEVESSTAMGQFDINKVCEDVICGLLKELYELPNLRNLNATEKANFPGIDLADDESRIAIQVTADKTLEKVKDTLKKVVKYKHYKKYDRIIIYILTKKQASYSNSPLSKICGEHIDFDANSDVLDQTDLSTKASNAAPKSLKSTVEILQSYTRGIDAGLADEDFDPSIEPMEELGSNLIELYFPTKLFIAEIISEALKTKTGRTAKNHRKAFKDFSRDMEQPTPSDFEALGGRIITFHDLERNDNPFHEFIEEGSVEVFTPKEFYRIDENHERVFKSLLRFVLQQKLYKHQVIWQHHERKFIFIPNRSGQKKRSESWTGLKKSSRMVYERKFKTNKPNEILSTRHFAFETDFVRIEDRWFVSLTPDWLFSFGDDFRRSFYGDKLLSGLKRMEKNKSVYDQVRFLCSWLVDIDSEDLFAETEAKSPSISFGDHLSMNGARALNEALWAPLTAPDEDENQERLV